MVHLTQLVTAISIASVSKHRQLCSGRPCGILHYTYYALSLFLAKVYYALVLSCIIFPSGREDSLQLTLLKF